ncbi:MAG: hypothetical protein OEM05_17305 [Myxococcales bacterium]|nr:hypothetical protein [Myxococcales bacterium]
MRCSGSRSTTEAAAGGICFRRRRKHLCRAGFEALGVPDGPVEGPVHSPNG